MILIYIVTILSFLLTFILLPEAIVRLKASGLTTTDRYKENRPQIANQGAILIIFILLLVCSFIPLIYKMLGRLGYDVGFSNFSEIDFIVLFVISLYSLYGLIDDIVVSPKQTKDNWQYGHFPKISVPILFGFPLMLVYDSTSINIPFFGNLDISENIFHSIAISDIIKVCVIPIYVMVVTNLVNMHSGFNGLQSGLSLIVLFTVLIKSLIDSNKENLLPGFCLLGSLMAFWFFNKYPSQILEGNIGSMCIGSCIGIYLVIKNYFFFGIFILLPHIADFLLYLYIKIKKINFEKYGKLREDGTIQAPNPIKMKFLFPYYFRLTEKSTVNILHLLTASFCFLGILIF